MKKESTIKDKARSLSFLEWMGNTVKSEHYSNVERMDNALQILQNS
jgi:hypothetical protein